MEEYKSENDLKTGFESWQSGRARSITFIVTEDCQLSCKYCYLIGKNNKGRMDFEIARKAIDYILSERNIFNDPSVIWEFIGGEPFLEIELMDKICDYIKLKMFEEDHPWFNSYRISISTNGILYDSEKVQNFINKNIRHISMGISIDGTKRKHDMQRVYVNGRGSYEDVVKNIPLWLKQFPDGATKVTISSDDIPYIKESVLHLFNLGIKYVNINVVFENVWKNGDDKLFEEQLIELSNEIITNDIYNEFYCSFFDKIIGESTDPVIDNKNWCGAGKMMSIDNEGNFYPCTRFAQYSLVNREAIIVGDVNKGIDLNKLRPFLVLDRTTQSPQECIECEVGNGCSWCQGFNYDDADSDTIFQRATYICKMHKARVRAKNYYWHILNKKLDKN